MSLNADEPISAESEDLLGRTRLVEVVAKYVLATDKKNPLVIGLNAPWGSGKSSFLNLLEKHLLSSEDSSPAIVIRFNPWLYKDTEQVTHSFFDELARGIDATIGRDEKMVKNLKLLGKVTGGIASTAFPVLTILSEIIENIPSPELPSLLEIRKELNEQLGNLNQRVVVLIDDLDRMEPGDILSLLKMVRLNANLTNITYVLAFDRKVVEERLDKSLDGRGHDYLDKIVQLPVNLPEPEADAVQKILLSMLDETVQSSNIRKLDTSRIRQLFLAGFGEYFQTIRQVKRYTNALQTGLSTIGKEVDPVDFMAIELIRVFHPDMYQEISKSKGFLTEDMTERRGFDLLDKGDRAKAKERFLEEVQGVRSSENSEGAVVKILQRIFPALHNTIYGAPFHEEWNRECRICSPHHFDKYFLLDVPSSTVPAVVVDAFLNSLDDLKATTATLRHFASDEKAAAFLKGLGNSVNTLPEEKAENLIKALCETGDGFDFNDTAEFVQASMRVFHIVCQCLKSIATKTARADLLLSVTREGQALCTAVDAVEGFLRWARKGWEGENSPLLRDEDLSSLRSIATDRIQSAWQDGTLWGLRDMASVLRVWGEWTDKEDVRAAIADHVEKDENLVAFISRHKSRSFRSTTTDSWVDDWISKEAISSVLDLDATVARLESIATREGELGQQARELLELINDPDSLD